MDIISYESSHVKWCEEKYKYTEYIVEYENTISSLFMVFVGLYGMCTESAQSQKYFLLLSFIGMFSAYFHATLSLLGQFLDELGITFIMLLALKKLYSKDSSDFIYVMYFGLFQIFIQFTYSSINRFLLFVYSILFLFKFKKMIMSTDDCIKHYANISLKLFTVSVICWIFDFVLCDFHIFNFHALWHIFIGLTTYFTIKTCSLYSTELPQYF